MILSVPPAFLGTRSSTCRYPLEEVFSYLDLQALIAGRWQFRKPREQSRGKKIQRLSCRQQVNPGAMEAADY